jgi:hypothetical protein
MAEPLVPGPSCLEVKISIAKFKKYELPSSDQIPAQLIQAGGEILLASQWKESIIVPINKKGDKTDCNYYRGVSLLST